jgi:hypothetical protein
MANGDGYVLNRDFWAPLLPGEDGKYSIVGRFSKGDTLTGVDIPVDFLEKATSGPQPVLLKKDSREAERQEASPVQAAADAQSTPKREEQARKQ